MFKEDWLTVVLPRVPATELESLVAEVARAVGEAGGVSVETAEAALLEALAGDGFSVGNGVAIPHTESTEIGETLVCLATLTAPLPLPTIDSVPPDIFVFILSRPDPHGHLLLLAHLARLMRSRTFVDGLRRCESAAEMTALVRAAELRHEGRPTASPALSALSRALVVMTVSGEKVVDALLVDLLEQGFDRSCILDAQSVREATTREVPLFSGFREVFGDPGGRRVILIEATLEQADTLIATARRVCEEHSADGARVSVLPVHTHWVAAPPAAARAVSGH